MRPNCIGRQHLEHAFADYHGRTREGLSVVSRRGVLKSSLLGLAGLTLPNLLERRAHAAAGGQSMDQARSVILLWLAGGPSHIDMWDPKPHRPYENRGPFSVISTRLPGVVLCEHLPKQAAMLDQFTLIRSVDAQKSNHEPNKVFQTGHLEAEPRINPRGDDYPAIGSVVAKHHGANQAGMPPYVTCMTSKSHIAFAGDLGQQYDPFIAQDAARLPIYTNVGIDTGRQTGADIFQLLGRLDPQRIHDRRSLLTQLDRIQRHIDADGTLAAADQFGQQAVQMLLGRAARDAFDLTQEPASMRDMYGRHLWCQQALLARRLVERGVAFVTLDLSYHPASGTWDTHGDNIPPYGGITKGLKPLLPLFDHLISTLVRDLQQRGLLNHVLVVAMGEFGRTPKMGTQGSTDGRDHWPNVMSICLAGGGLRHGQVIGSSDRDGAFIHERPVTPGDLAATIYRHMDVPLDTTYTDLRGRPMRVVPDGQPLRELF
jgi:uncharacterized protein (DUF1501 family)